MADFPELSKEQYVHLLKNNLTAWNTLRERYSSCVPNLTRAELAGINLSGANLDGLILNRADLGGSDLIGASLKGANLNQANLKGTDLEGADLTDAKLVKTDLTLTNLKGVIFNHTNLIQANLNGLDMTGAELIGASLNEAKLEDSDLSRADLSHADLSWAVMSRVRLRQAHLSQANLSSVDLSEGDLSNANLTGADMERADLTGANLSGANLTGASLEMAHMAKAKLDETAFGSTNLYRTEALDAIEFWGPCSIDHRTIERSSPLQPAFLRGCGLPDSTIEAFTRPIPYDSCYICYSRYSAQDQAFVDKLHYTLQERGVRCWFAPYDKPDGSKPQDLNPDAARTFERVLLVLSDFSRNSNWALEELKMARKRELKEDKKVLHAVSLLTEGETRGWVVIDEKKCEDLTREIREGAVLDFSAWDHKPAWIATIEQLLNTLKRH